MTQRRLQVFPIHGTERAQSIARRAVLTALLSGAIVVFGAQSNARSQLSGGLRVGAAFPDVLAKTIDRKTIGEVVPSGSAACVVFFHPT